MTQLLCWLTVTCTLVDQVTAYAKIICKIETLGVTCRPRCFEINKLNRQIGYVGYKNN